MAFDSNSNLKNFIRQCVCVGGQFKAEQHDMENKTLIPNCKKRPHCEIMTAL